jgi:trk system potassium uptake protein
MYVVVVGMGEVGSFLINVLDKEGHDVVAIDASEDQLASVEDEQDVATLHGHGGSPAVLLNAGVDKADLLVTCTDDDEINLVGALFGKKLGAKRTVARIQGTEYTGENRGIHQDMLGIDVVINPRILIAQEITKIARSHGALDVLGLVGNQVELVQMRLPEKSKMLHKSLANLPIPKETLVVAVVRDEELFVPGGSDVLLPGDRIYVIGRTGQMESCEDLFTGGKEATRIFIVGGGVVGQTLAHNMEEADIDVVLLEKNRAKAERLGNELPHAEILHGDGTDLSIIESEQVGSFDLVCAVTKDDEVNLMAALLAKREGAQRVVCLVQRPDYTEIYRQLGIDVVLSPREVAIEHILRYVRETELQSLTILEQGQAEILELVANAGSRVVGTPIHRLNMPRGALLATLVTDGVVRIPTGADQVAPGDTVVVLCTAAARPAVERLFKKRIL